MEPTNLEMMKNPASWPRWPYLPVMKNCSSGREVAVMFAEGKPIVYRVNMFRVISEKIDITKIPKLEYESFEKLAEDG